MTANREPLFERILGWSPFSESELFVLIKTAPKRYKEHFIKKRNNRGLRLIAQPTAELKLIQRVLIENELHTLPVHDSAIAYRNGLSIKDHVTPHRSSRYLLKLDFRDFFSSIKERTLLYRLSCDTTYSEKEKKILCNLLMRSPGQSRQLELSIGAPSSPFVSNYIMWEFDSKLKEICTQRGADYTRYADDIAISTSTPSVLDGLKMEVEELLSTLRYLDIKLNEEKTVNVSKKFRRTLVGLTISNSGGVSIGRAEKRLLRATAHSFQQGILQPKDIDRLRGRLAFTYSIDPAFVAAICKRIGVESINDIRPKIITTNSKDDKEI